MKSFLLTPLFFLTLFSCKESPKEKIARLVTEWQGKEIIFPLDMVFAQYMTDTVDNPMLKTNYKVFIYVDSLGCTSCKLQLPKWKELIMKVDSLTNNQIPFLFIFHPKDYKEIKYILKRDGFNYPVCIDKEDILNKQNKFPSNITFQTFLLNKENKVVVIGNPIHNLAVKDLYLKQLTQEKQSTGQAIVTTAIVIPFEVNVSKVTVKQTKKVNFTIQNTGNNPLVILEASTTCGCAVTIFDKHPAKPGESLNLTVEMTPKESGMFDETIMVKCNTDKPIQLKIKGQAIIDK